MSTEAIYERAGWGHNVDRGTRPGIIAVDFTNGFSDPDSPTGSDLSGPIAATNQLVAAARMIDAPVIWTRIAYTPAELEPGAITWLTKAQGMRSLVEGSPAAELDERCHVLPVDPIVTKKGASAFAGTHLNQLLTARRVDTVIVCGATTSGCIRATVVDAVQTGFSVLVPRDAVGDRAPEPHAANLFDMQAKYADVISLDDALTWLSGLTGTTPIDSHESSKFH